MANPSFLFLLALHSTEFLLLWWILHKFGVSRNRAVNISIFVTLTQFSIWVKLLTGGWLTLLFYPVVGVHIALCLGALEKGRSDRFDVAAASLAFFFATLFVPDGGDGPGWLPVLALIEGDGLSSYAAVPEWIDNGPFLLLVVLPVIFTWVRLIVANESKKESLDQTFDTPGTGE